MCLGNVLTNLKDWLLPCDAPVRLLPIVSPGDCAVCLLSLIRNRQLQRAEVDSGKKMIFTNNIPKAGFLIDPTDPVSRRPRQVWRLSGAPGGGRGWSQGWGALQQSPLPAWGHVLSSGLSRVPSWVNLSLLLVPWHRGTRRPRARAPARSEASLGQTGPHPSETR